jgi:predicted DsbA family dithiol-disulfide isomerase
MEIAEEDLGLKFDLRWRPYFLNPKLTNKGIDKRVAYSKRMGKKGVAKMERGMAKIFADEGIEYTLDGQMSSTLNSHRLMELAHMQGGGEWSEFRVLVAAIMTMYLFVVSTAELQDKMAEVSQLKPLLISELNAYPAGAVS